MIPDFTKNGLIKERAGESSSSVFVVVDVTKLPRYESQIIQPLGCYFPAYDEKRGDGCVGAQCRNVDGTPRFIEDIVDKLAKQFGLWHIPFFPRKAGESYLETLFNTYIWRRKGKIYVPDWIEFEGTYGDLKRVVEFYGGFHRIKPSRKTPSKLIKQTPHYPNFNL